MASIVVAEIVTAMEAGGSRCNVVSVGISGDTANRSLVVTILVAVVEWRQCKHLGWQMWGADTSDGGSGDWVGLKGYIHLLNLC